MVRGAVVGRSLVGALTVLAPLIAHAEPAPRQEPLATSALSWVRLPGAEPCISTPDLGARIEKHLGRRVLVSPSVADVSIEGRVARSGSGDTTTFRATVGGVRRDGSPIGSREIVSAGADCHSLDDGLVLVVALMIDPRALEPVQPPTPAQTPDAVVTREIIHERVIVREVDRPPSAEPRATWTVQASLVGVAAVERLPGVAPGMGLGLRAGPSRTLAFEISVGLVPAASLDVGTRAVDYSLFEGGFAYCPSVALGSRVDAIGCGGLRIGAIRSRGRDFRTNAEIDRGLADIALGARLLATISGPLFVLASATALVPLVRQDTTVTNESGQRTLLHERSLLGAELGIGLGLRFSP